MKLIALLLCYCTTASFAQQKYFTKTGKISFDATSTSSPDKIFAVNKNVACVIETSSGDVQFSALMKGFEFEKALMMEHFNENYIESSKYPKAVFKGTIQNISSIKFTTNGTYIAKVKGNITLHGQTKEIETTGSIVVKDAKISLTANFTVIVADFKISIPTVVANSISKTVKVNINCNLEAVK